MLVVVVEVVVVVGVGVVVEVVVGVEIEVGVVVGVEIEVGVMMLNPAISIAKYSSHRFRHAAILIVDDKIYVGYNQNKTHPLAARFNEKSIHIHAELAAILHYLRKNPSKSRQEALQRLKTGTLYVARVLKNGLPAPSKPCVGCQGLIASFGIQEVYWT